METRHISLFGQDDLFALIRDCIVGKRSAQKALYDRYAPAAYGVIRRYTSGTQDAIAQEILNDAFYKVLTRLEQYSFQGAFEGWIRKIVINTVTDYFKRNVKDRTPFKELHPEDASTASGQVEQMALKELLAMVQSLPDMHRAVFNLFVMESYSHKDIAEALSIKENNSRWYLNDARKRLKEKINDIS
jgi:RNA polymerase sigma factor (sigma-70 family)